MFFVEDNGKIVLQDSDKNRLEKTLELCPEYKGYAIREIKKNIVNGLIEGSDEYNQVVDNALKESELAKLRNDLLGAILSDNEEEIAILKSKYKAMIK